MARPARVFLGPEPEDGGHTSITGLLDVDPIGVNVPVGSMYSSFQEGEWPPDGLRFYTEAPILLPWHRVDQVEWLTSSELREATGHGDIQVSARAAALRDA